MSDHLRPQRPNFLPPYAEECLMALANLGLGRHISIGGAFGLSHYHEYRQTHDVDAWWRDSAASVDQVAVTQALQNTLSQYGAVRIRTWGEVVSVELLRDKRVIFSFQIARRSARLLPEAENVWPGELSVDSLEDIVASKMTALINRGAPRDFLDIYELCKSDVLSKEECWRLWQDRSIAAGESPDSKKATLAIQSSLARIEVARPVMQGGDKARLRTWYNEVFLNGVV